MKPSNHSIVLAIALLAAFCSQAQAASGPTSTLYIMNYGEFNSGNSTGLDIIVGNTVTSYNTNYLIDIDIAVYGDVRTQGYSDTTQGDRFDLSGTPLSGGPYTNNVADSQLHDGTSDGNYNYSVDYVTGDLLQFDRNWASPTVLFNVTGTLPGAGYITMDLTDGSFWISQWGGPDAVNHYTSTGSLLSSFNSGLTANFGLALDPVDGTLWMADNSYNLYQFDQAGNPLQSLNYSSVSAGGWYGMEFDTQIVPEPSTLALTAIGTTVLAIRAWRRRNS